MSRFHTALQSDRVLLMDGAMGTELLRAGLSQGECGELWNLSRPDQVRAIHQAYVDAGAECLLTNTFQSNPGALSRHGHEEEIELINHAALRLARQAAGADRFVVADVGPLAETYRSDSMQRIARSLSGADALLLETYSDLHALWLVKYACLPVLEPEGPPILLSITYLRNPSGTLTTQGGQSPEVFARLARQYGVAALGVNCGREVGMGEIIEIIHRYRQATNLPLFARPNAGTPSRVDDQWVYPHTPESMARRLPELLEAGARLIGGCCGAGPAHIAAFRPIIDEWNTRHPSADVSSTC
jgi:5-methyltetrahydrofolate--homocysteine methyltransferase